MIHIFIAGCIVGISFNYFGVTSFVSGLLSGIIIQNSKPQIGENIVNFGLMCSDLFINFLNKSLITVNQYDKYKDDKYNVKSTEKQETENETELAETKQE